MTLRRARLDGGQSVGARGRCAFLDHRERPAQVNVGWGEHREPQLSFFYIASIPLTLKSSIQISLGFISFTPTYGLNPDLET